MQDDATPRGEDIQHIYRQLKKGLGHELVNDGNVFALIDMAAQGGHQLLEQELREWQSPCGSTTAADNPGQGKAPAAAKGPR